jgi:hypothetical protein
MVYPHPQDEPPPDPDDEGLIPARYAFGSVDDARLYVRLRVALLRVVWSRRD